MFSAQRKTIQSCIGNKLLFIRASNTVHTLVSLLCSECISANGRELCSLVCLRIGVLLGLDLWLVEWLLDCFPLKSLIDSKH